VHERSAIGVLGVLVAGLSLAALAAQQPPPAAPAGVASTRAPSPTSAALRALRDGARIDLNRAQPGDLELLPGLGPKLARRIVEHRRVHGAFRTSDELLQVHAIGPRTLQRLKPLLEVSVPTPGRLEGLPAQPPSHE
jgi:competence protein ComEA